MKLLILLCSAALPAMSAQAADNAEKTTAESGWKALGLESVEMPGATLYYETGLSEQEGTFRQSYEHYMRDQADRDVRNRGLLDKRDDILAEINRIVGSTPNAVELADQTKVFTGGVKMEGGLFETAKPRSFYLVTQATIKTCLRKGGALPCFTYDKKTDTVEYAFQSGKAHGLPLEITVPIAGAPSAEREIPAFFSMLSDGTGFFSAASFHEVAELAIFSRLRPDDPYFRWFSDGFANAVALRVMRRHLSEQAVENFMASYKVAAFADVEKQINLCYWMGLDYSVETPLEGEKRLEMARYAYATFEADRLLERHGADCARRILDEVVACKTNDSRCLFPAALKVTGEDLEKRFRRYQPFDTKEECIEHYAEKYNAAADRKDYAEAIPAMLRLLELRGLEDPRFYSNAALMLYRMGSEDMGDRAILKHADLCQRRGNTAANIIMHKLFIDYAMQCRNLQKALPSAEIVSQTEPDYVPAMAVAMLSLGGKGEADRARRLAGRILELEPNRESPWRQLAEKARPTPAADNGGARPIQVVKTWQDLLGQPAISLDAAAARLGIEARSAPCSSGILLYCLTEGYSLPREWKGRNRLGPFQVEIRHEADTAGQSKSLEASLLSLGRLDIRHSTALFRRSIPLDRPGTFHVRVRSPEGALLAETQVTATREACHPWMPLEPAAPRAEAGAEYRGRFDAVGNVRNRATGIAIPHFDGMAPMLFRSDGPDSRIRRLAGEQLPTLVPKDAGAVLTIKARGADLLVESKVDIILARPDWHFLARWWVNGIPHIPAQMDNFSDENGQLIKGKNLLLHLDLDRRRLAAAPGDAIDIQLLYCKHGSELVQSGTEMLHAPVDTEGPELLLSNRIRLVREKDGNPTQ